MAGVAALAAALAAWPRGRSSGAGTSAQSGRAALCEAPGPAPPPKPPGHPALRYGYPVTSHILLRDGFVVHFDPRTRNPLYALEYVTPESVNTVRVSRAGGAGVEEGQEEEGEEEGEEEPKAGSMLRRWTSSSSAGSGGSSASFGEEAAISPRMRSRLQDYNIIAYTINSYYNIVYYYDYDIT